MDIVLCVTWKVRLWTNFLLDRLIFAYRWFQISVKINKPISIAMCFFANCRALINYFNDWILISFWASIKIRAANQMFQYQNRAELLISEYSRNWIRFIWTIRLLFLLLISLTIRMHRFVYKFLLTKFFKFIDNLFFVMDKLLCVTLKVRLWTNFFIDRLIFAYRWKD